MEDLDIVNLIYNRNEIGIAELKMKYNELLYSLALSILKNDADSEESVNDTYLKIWRTIPPYKPTYLKSFVCKITRQISIDIYRANHRKNEESLNEIDYEISSSYSLNELSNLINEFLEKQDVESQVLFIRRYFLNESVKNLSKGFEMTETNISVKLLRTRKKLKKYLEMEGYKVEKY